MDKIKTFTLIRKYKKHVMKVCDTDNIWDIFNELHGSTVSDVNGVEYIIKINKERA